MPFHSLATAALAVAGFLAALGPASAASPDLLERHRGIDRLLVVSAGRSDDPQVLRQREAYEAMRPGARERDLVLVEAVGEGTAAQAVRARLGLDPSRFAVVLVGKDGGAKLRADDVLGPDQLFPVIDAMPMRQNEMRR